MEKKHCKVIIDLEKLNKTDQSKKLLSNLQDIIIEISTATINNNLTTGIIKFE